MEDLRRIVLDPKKFRAARERAGLSQQEAAAKVGVGKSAMCKFELGGALPSANILVRFCLLVNANVSELAGRARRVS